jgi:hypothetical protein
VLVCVKHEPFDPDAFKAENEPRLNSSERTFLTARQLEAGMENYVACFATPEPSEGHATLVDVGGMRVVPRNNSRSEGEFTYDR